MTITYTPEISADQQTLIEKDVDREIEILEMEVRLEESNLKDFHRWVEEYGVRRAVSSYGQAAAESEEKIEIYGYFLSALRLTRQERPSQYAREKIDARTDNLRNSLIRSDLWESNCTNEFDNAVGRAKAKAAQSALPRGERLVRLFDDGWLKGKTNADLREEAEGVNHD